ncbi:MAG: hypothetical protein MZV70_71150 [Desulfobacterales bacterium]|nr:hypothetical protein [Desulfobacterales bacterium]
MENVGAGDLQLPQNEMHTTAYWLTVPSALHAGRPLPGRAADQRPVRPGLPPPPRLAALHDVRPPRRRRVDRRQHLGRVPSGRWSRS